MKRIEPTQPASSEPLSKKVVRGGIWVFALRFANRGLGFIRIIILARLLAPHDFGLLGIAMLAISTVESFSQTGFQAALIQKKRDIESYLDTAWTVSAIRGIVLFLILFFSAPIIAKFFNSSQATLVIRVIAISTLVSGFKNMGILFFQRELEFNKQFFYSMSATLAELAIAIPLALILRNVWALVWGGLAANFVGFFSSYALHPYRPKIKLEAEKFDELFGFGRWVLGANIVIFLATQGDDAFLGKVLGVTALGFYQMAFNIGNYPSSEITGVTSKVAFPTYSKLQEVRSQLEETYLRIIRFSTFLSVPLTGGIVVLAPQFTQIFLGEKWVPIVAPLQILALSGMFRSIAGTGGAMFSAIGKPKLDFKMNVTRLMVIAVSIYPLTMLWGISGTSLSVLLGILAACFTWFFTSIKETEISGRGYISVLLFPLLGTFFMCGVIICILKTATVMNSQLFVFLISIIIGISVYFGVMLIVEKKSRYGGLQDIKLVLKNLRGDQVENL